MRYLSTTTDASGHFTLDCVGSAYFTGHARLDNSVLRVGSGGIAYSVPIYVYDTCGGGSGSHFIPSSDGGRVWANLITTIGNSTAHFARTRPKVPVDVVTSGETYYSPASDVIRIDHSRIWGQDGFRVAAHEYGHGFHEKALGGMQWAPGQCPAAGHWLNGAYGLKCAYVEGFAQFFAALMMQDSLSGYNEDLFETPPLPPASHLAIAQGTGARTRRTTNWACAFPVDSAVRSPWTAREQRSPWRRSSMTSRTVRARRMALQDPTTMPWRLAPRGSVTSSTPARS